MYIKKVKLFQFRNYTKEEIELKNGINIFFGDNGEGKTNILEAIFLCAIGKSFRAKKEKELIEFEKQNAKIEIEFEKKDRKGKIEVEINDKKNIYINEIKQSKLSDILGKINIVMFSPDDINILKSGPSNRRKFLNIMISQLRPKYIYNLNMYLKTLEQRNNYLKQIKDNKQIELLDVWDEKLAEYAESVYRYRYEFIEKIKEKIVEIHNNITSKKEEIKIHYITDCKNKEEYLENLKRTRQSDILNGYTRKRNS